MFCFFFTVLFPVGKDMAHLQVSKSYMTGVFLMEEKYLLVHGYVSTALIQILWLS